MGAGGLAFFKHHKSLGHLSFMLIGDSDNGDFSNFRIPDDDEATGELF